MSAEKGINILDMAYEEYFSLLDEYFKGIYMPGIDKNLQANYIIHMKKAAQVVLMSIDDITQDISEFWKKYTEPVLSFLRYNSAFKALYCGSVSPLEGQQFVKRTAMYVDSILIEDPITTIVNMKDLSTDNSYLMRMIRHAFNLMDLKELFFGQGDFPILTIFPSFLDENRRQDIVKGIHQNGLTYFSELLELNFTDIEDFFDHLKTYNDPEKFFKMIKHPEMLPKPNNQSTFDFINEVHQSISRGRKDTQDITVGMALGLKILGQLTGIGINLFQSKNLHSQLVFDSENYWKIYKWDLSEQKKGPDIDNLIVNSLNLEQFDWLGNIPIDKLVLLRREGELSKIREILRKNIYSCTHSDGDLKMSAQQAIENIEVSLKEHTKQVSEIEKSLKKKYLIDGPIVIGGLLTGIFSGPLSPISFAGLAFSLYGGYDWFKNILAINKTKKETESSIFGILFKAKNKG